MMFKEEELEYIENLLYKLREECAKKGIEAQVFTYTLLKFAFEECLGNAPDGKSSVEMIERVMRDLWTEFDDMENRKIH